MVRVWPGSLSSLCTCILFHFQHTQSNLDNSLYKKFYPNESKSKTKVISVQLRKTDSDLVVRQQSVWEGKEGKKERGNLAMFYWAVRTERRDLLLSEVLCRVFSELQTKGFTHVEHTISGKKYTVTLASMQRRTVRMVPRSVIISVRGATGDWPAPDDSGVFHHYVVGDAGDGSTLAIDIGFAQYHPDPIAFNKDTKGGVSAELDPIFRINQESDLLNEISFSSKSIHESKRLEADVSIKSPLFKRDISAFFCEFPLNGADSKATGNTAFENKDYVYALLWYSWGIAFEIDDPESSLTHILYGNRSTAYYQLGELNKALDDADSAIRVAPHWPKGYLRKSAVLTALGREKDAKRVLDDMEAAEKELSQPKNKKRKT